MSITDLSMAAYPVPLTSPVVSGLPLGLSDTMDEQWLSFPEQLNVPPPAQGDPDLRALLQALPT